MKEARGIERRTQTNSELDQKGGGTTKGRLTMKGRVTDAFERERVRCSRKNKSQGSLVKRGGPCLKSETLSFEG